MSGYSTEGWHDLFILAGGATAALSGLIFVGLSVNIKEVWLWRRRTERLF